MLILLINSILGETHNGRVFTGVRERKTGVFYAVLVLVAVFTTAFTSYTTYSFSLYTTFSRTHVCNTFIPIVIISIVRIVQWRFSFPFNFSLFSLLLVTFLFHILVRHEAELISLHTVLKSRSKSNKVK